MTTHNDYIQLRGRRPMGFRSCIAEGWKLFALHACAHLRFMALYALAAGLGCAAALMLATRLYAGRALPVRLAVEAGLTPDEARALWPLTSADCVAAALALLALTAGIYLCKGAGWVAARAYAATGRPPAGCPLKAGKAAARAAVRCLGFDAWGAAVCLVATAVALAPAWQWGTRALAWTLPPLLLIYIYVWVAAAIGRQQCLAGGTGIRKAWRAALHESRRTFGSYLLILLLTGVPLATLFCAVLAPAAVFPLSAAADAASRLSGEADGLPAAHPWLFAAVATAACAACALAASQRRLCLTLRTAGRPDSAGRADAE